MTVTVVLTLFFFDRRFCFSLFYCKKKDFGKDDGDDEDDEHDEEDDLYY